MMASLDDEPSSMKTAYLFLKYLDEGAQRRSLDWIVARLAEDRRGREAKAYAGPIPSEWRFDDGSDSCGSYNSRDEGFEEVDVGPGGIVEITGHAAVCQEFVVMVPIGDGDGAVESYEPKSFATRAEAEAYAASMQGEAIKDTAFEMFLQELEAGGAHVDRADPENEGMWRRHFDAGKPAGDFVPVAGDDEVFRQWLAKVLLLGGRVYHDGGDDMPIWREYFDAWHTPEKAVELAAMNR